MCLFVYFSIDETETECLGKYVNDISPIYANAKMKLIMVTEIPALGLLACVDGMKAGTELR